MFGFLRYLKRRRVAKDIQKTLLTTFVRLAEASKKNNALERRYLVVAALAACRGALLGAYRNVLPDEENIAMALVEANAVHKHKDADALSDAILNIVRDCPNDKDEQISSVLWMISPTLGHKARNVLRAA